MHRSVKLVVSAAALAFAAFAAHVAPAQALLAATVCTGADDPFANPQINTCVSLGNNWTHTFRLVNIRSDIASSFRVAMVHYDQTDLSVYERDPSDVVVMNRDYFANNLVGWVNCPPGATQGGVGTSRWCYGQYLRINLFYSGDLDTAAERQDVACHEFGHTVGLNHTVNPDSCMNDDRMWGDNFTFDETERTEINFVYFPY